MLDSPHHNFVGEPLHESKKRKYDGKRIKSTLDVGVACAVTSHRMLNLIGSKFHLSLLKFNENNFIFYH